MDNSLSGVSCTAVGACEAVGYCDNGTAYETLAESWNGKRWGIQPTPNPSNQHNDLYAVSCGSGFRTLAERWNGSTWAVPSTPNPAGTSGSYLRGLSCPGAHACAAVGDYHDVSGDFETLAEAEGGA